MREGCSYTIARYSFIQLSEVEQCRVNNLPKVLTPQHRIRTRILLVESTKLYPLSHCTQVIISKKKTLGSVIIKDKIKTEK